MELGVYTFGDLMPDPKTGATVSPRERTRQMLELARLADEAGLDVMGVGEHHGADYVNSATATLIAAMAAVTNRIRLTSASTLLGTTDPVRTFQEFATADLVSDGRVEIIFGRGAFRDNFPLFGFDLADYDALFAEKLELFARLNAQERVTWSGRFRAPLVDAEIAPRPVQPRLPVWIGAGSPASVTRAAQLGYPLAIPMLRGNLDLHTQTAALYRQVWRESGHDPESLRLAAFSHFHVTETGDLDTFRSYYDGLLARFTAFTGMPASFEQMASPTGSLMAGGPQQVIDKIMALHEAVGISRYLGQVDVAGQPFADVVRSLEIFATRIAPVVRAETAARTPAAVVQ